MVSTPTINLESNLSRTEMPGSFKDSHLFRWHAIILEKCGNHPDLTKKKEKMKILVCPSAARVKREFKIVRGRTKLAAVVCWLIDASPLSSNTGHIHTFGFEKRNDRLARGQIMQMKLHLSTCKRHFPITHHSCALIKKWLRRRLSIKQADSFVT